MNQQYRLQQKLPDICLAAILTQGSFQNNVPLHLRLSLVFAEMPFAHNNSYYGVSYTLTTGRCSLVEGREGLLCR